MDSNCSGGGFHIASFLLQEGRFAGSTVKALLLVRGVPMTPEGEMISSYGRYRWLRGTSTSLVMALDARLLRHPCRTRRHQK